MKQKIELLIFISILKFYSLIPFSINLKSSKATKSFKCFICAVVMFIIFAAFEIFLDIFVFSQTTGFFHIKKTYSIDILIIPILLIFICVAWTLLNSKLCIQITNDLFLIENQLNGFKMSNEFYLKFLITQTLILCTDFIYYFVYGEACNVIWVLLYTPLVGFKFLFETIFLMKYDFSLIVLESGFSKVNTIISGCMKDRKRINSQIEELSLIHFKLCEISKMNTKFFSIPIISIIGYIFITVNKHLLQMFRNYKSEKNVLRMFCSFSWSFARFCELIMVLRDGRDVIKKVIVL